MYLVLQVILLSSLINLTGSYRFYEYTSNFNQACDTFASYTMGLTPRVSGVASGISGMMRPVLRGLRWNVLLRGDSLRSLVFLWLSI